jgi:uncharacterized membrane protein YkvA (DUF1232 family)
MAFGHPMTPRYAKVLASGVIIDALSLFDLIPDPIPILGYLDDMIIVPLGVLMVHWAIPTAVLDDCQKQATIGAKINAT